MIFLLDNNRVYWTGMRIAYKPEMLKLDYDNIGKIKKIAACSDALAVVTEDNKIYFKNNFI